MYTLRAQPRVIGIERTLLTIILAELLVCLGLIAYAVIRNPAANHGTLAVQPTAKVKSASSAVSYGSPLRLIIPKINVDAPLDYVDITPQGILDAPNGPTKVGWYNRGTRPGEVGSAVMDGHFGYKKHIPAVFDNLHTLQKGDTLLVEDDRGKLIAFVVRESRSLGLKDDATSVFHSNDGKAHLNLITCQGTWNESQKSYSTRLVVFADLIL